MRTDKANDNLTPLNTATNTDRVILPLPPLGDDTKLEMEVYARFMRHLRYVPNSRMEIKVLTAIQYVADMMDMQDCQVAKILVDLGLRGSRMALPAMYLEYADYALMRGKWDMEAANASLRELYEYWAKIGEDRFAAFKRTYPILSEECLTRV